MADDEAHRVAVGRDEVLHATLEVCVVEDLRRQIERVVVPRCVERITHRGRVVLLRRHLILRALLDLILRQHHRLHRLHGVDLGRQERGQLRHERIEALHVGHHRLDVIGQGVDAVERVEYPTDRPTHRDVVAVRLPVQVAPQGTQEVVEILYLVAHLGGVDHRVLELGDHAVQGGRHLQHEALTSSSSCRWSSASHRPDAACRPSRSCWYLRFIVDEVPCMLSMERDRACV